MLTVCCAVCCLAMTKPSQVGALYLIYRSTLAQLAVSAAVIAQCIGTQVLLLGDMDAVQLGTIVYSTQYSV